MVLVFVFGRRIATMSGLMILWPILLNGEIFYTLKEAKTLIEKWRMEYNTFRPHSSLNYRPPAPEAYLN
jgi:transposase InsO family protein